MRKIWTGGKIMNNKRFAATLAEIALGGTLLACGTAGIVDEFWSGMGVGLLAVGILRLVKHIRYRTNDSYRENVDMRYKDERNKFIGGRAWAWAGYLFLLIVGCSVIVFKIIGQELLMMAASYSVCLLAVLYWLCYLVLNKKY